MLTSRSASMSLPNVRCPQRLLKLITHSMSFPLQLDAVASEDVPLAILNRRLKAATTEEARQRIMAEIQRVQQVSDVTWGNVENVFRGRFRNAYELLNLRTLKISTLYKIASFNVWVRYFVWNFKGNLWNSTQNILPIHWKTWFSHKIEILRIFRSFQVFWQWQQLALFQRTFLVFM